MNANPEKENTQGRFTDHCIDMEEDNEMLNLDVCSATECTGLIPAMPETESEITSYEQLYHFLPRAKDQ